MTWKVPLTTLTIGEEEQAAAVRVLKSGWLTQGPEVEAFEREFALACGSEFAIATANATDALALAYDAVGVSGGEEIAMCALTFVASMNVAIRRGERPLLIDITSEDDLTMSTEDLERKITPNTHLIVTMPYGGFAPDMRKTMEIADRHNIPVVEDACHGLLGRARGHRLGTFGAAGVFSFFGNKNMTTGEGGMIVTNDRPIAERARMMRSHGMTRSTFDHFSGRFQEYDVMVAGHNFRMDEIRAAIGREQLKKVPAANRRRCEIAQIIRERIAALRPEIKFPFAKANQADSSHHLLPALLPQGTNRAMFMYAMSERGVQTSVHYRPLHRFTHTLGLWPEPPQLPVLESIEKRLVTLPLGPGFTDEQIDLIVRATAESVV